MGNIYEEIFNKIKKDRDVLIYQLNSCRKIFF